MRRPYLTPLLAAAALTLSACAQTTAAPPLSQAETNRRNVLAFYDKALNQKDADAAVQYLGPRYVQHNPVAADGVEGFRQFIGYLRDKQPRSHSEIKRSFVDGDYVILHVHAVNGPGDRGSAIIDIFKLENGKIVEHWDAIQPVPAKAANRNGMF